MPDSSNSRPRATYQDLAGVPDHMVGELVDGVLYTSPRPAGPHVVTGSALGGELVPPFQNARGGPGGWWILDEPELHFGQDVLVPDLAGWRRERMAGRPSDAYFTAVPDWVCEVLSPSTVRLDRGKKLGVYAREGVPGVWLIDPLAKTLEVLVLDGRHWVIHSTHTNHDRVRAVPFASHEIELAYLWGEVPIPAKQIPIES